MNRSICTIGTGYVGMASMVGLAELGWAVNGYDILPERIRKLQTGVAPYREAGIEEALHTHLAQRALGVLRVSSRTLLKSANLIIVAVGTPARDDGSADLSALFIAIDALAQLNLTNWPTVVIRSTVPPGTSDQLAKMVEGWGELVYAPEFLREGSAVYDFLHPDRIVVGSEGAGAVPYVKLFESLQKPVLFTSRCNAELIKCGSNAFLALKISFANEIANLCDALGATSDDVLRGIGYDRRIGSQFLSPGIGFGGPCFEKDVKSIEHVAAKHNMGRELFSATLRVNEAQQTPHHGHLVEEEVGSVQGLTIGVWGLAFKAGTDDVRDSLAVRIIEMLAERGATVVAYDPAVHVTTLPKGCRLVPTALEAAEAPTSCSSSRNGRNSTPFLLNAYAASIQRRVVIDGRNVLDAATWASQLPA